MIIVWVAQERIAGYSGILERKSVTSHLTSFPSACVGHGFEFPAPPRRAIPKGST